MSLFDYLVGQLLQMQGHVEAELPLGTPVLGAESVHTLSLRSNLRRHALGIFAFDGVATPLKQKPQSLRFTLEILPDSFFD